MAIIWFSENAVVTSYFVGFSFFGVFFPLCGASVLRREKGEVVVSSQNVEFTHIWEHTYSVWMSVYRLILLRPVASCNFIWTVCPPHAQR